MRANLFFLVDSFLPQASADDNALRAAATHRAAGSIAFTAMEPASCPWSGLARWLRRGHPAKRAADPAHAENDVEMDLRIRRLERAVGGRYY